VPRVSAAEFAAALRGFVDSARVVLLSFPRRAQVERDYPELAEYTAGIEKVAAELGVPLVDLRGEFRSLPDQGEALFLDGTHLNVQGNARVAERLVGPIRGCLAGNGGVIS
jgi:hypothetical protein